MANLSKIVNLIKKTGDKAIILDESGEPSFVMMTLNDYENLTLGRSEVAGLTEEELLDKINRDIAIWKDTQNTEDLPIDQYDFAQEIDDLNDLIPNSSEPEEAKEPKLADIKEDHYYFEPVE